MRALRIAGISLLLLACTPSVTAPGPFSGIWAGGNASYQASLSLSQVADTVSGGFRITRRIDNYTLSSPALRLALRGDSVVFSFPAPASSGYSTVAFRGQRRGDRLDSEVALDSTLIPLTLDRQ